MENYISKQKQLYAKAYARWTEEEDSLLRSLFQNCMGLKEIAAKLERNVGAVRARLRKMGLL